MVVKCKNKFIHMKPKRILFVLLNGFKVNFDKN